MAPLPIGIAFVETFFDQEKENAKRLIRHEMESLLLDPLVESLFGQLKTKFVNYVGASSEFLNYEGDGKMIRDQGTNVQQYHAQSLLLENESNSIDANCKISSINNLEPPLVLIKKEIDDLSNVPLEPPMSDVSVNSSSSSSSLLPESIFPSSDESLPNTEMKPSQLAHIKHNQFDDDEECDCDDCVYGGIEIKEEEEEDEDDDEDSFQLIDDDQDVEETSPPVKKARMDPTQPKMMIKQPINGANNQQIDKQIITLGLQCPECSQTIFQNKHGPNLIEQFKDHLWIVHSSHLYRCPVKDCVQSFDIIANLTRHVKEAHHNMGTTKWNCSKCPSHFSKYPLLATHNINQHQLGQYQCSFPHCTFTGECKRQVYNHYDRQHKPDLACRESGCDFRTKDRTRFKAHERAHLGIEPYRCKWADCGYSSASRNNAMMHIKVAHFKAKSKERHDLSHLGKPKDYLEVVS